MAFADQTFGVFNAGYMGKNVYLEYVQEVYKKKSYLKPGINANGALSINVDGSALTYWTLPTNGVTTGYLGNLHTASAGQIKGLKAKTVTIDTGEIIDALIPAAAKLAGASAVEGIYVQNVIKAVNNINVAFVAAAETGAKEIDAAGKVTGDTGFGTALAYDAADVIGSITKAKAAFNKKNAVSGYKPTSLFVSSDVYADMQAKNLLIFKPISLEDGSQVEVYNFLGMDVTECPEMATYKMIIANKDGLFGAANLNFVVENENDPAVPAGVSIKGEMGHAEGLTDLGDDFAGCLVVGLK